MWLNWIDWGSFLADATYTFLVIGIYFYLMYDLMINKKRLTKRRYKFLSISIFCVLIGISNYTITKLFLLIPVRHDFAIGIVSFLAYSLKCSCTILILIAFKSVIDKVCAKRRFIDVFKENFGKTVFRLIFIVMPFLFARAIGIFSCESIVFLVGAQNMTYGIYLLMLLVFNTALLWLTYFTYSKSNTVKKGISNLLEEEAYLAANRLSLIIFVVAALLYILYFGAFETGFVTDSMVTGFFVGSVALILVGAYRIYRAAYMRVEDAIRRHDLKKKLSKDLKAAGKNADIKVTDINKYVDVLGLEKLDDQIRQMWLLCHGKGVEFEVRNRHFSEAPIGALIGAGYPQKDLDAIFLNIFENSLKSCSKLSDGALKRIYIRISGRDDRVTIQIIDTGEPMSQEIYDKIGTPFNTSGADEGGKGLGLLSIKRSVERYKGAVDFSELLNPVHKMLTIDFDLRDVHAAARVINGSKFKNFMGKFFKQNDQQTEEYNMGGDISAEL